MKATLLALLLMVSVAATAQNYIGLTRVRIESELDRKGIEYEGFYNTGGGYTIAYKDAEDNYRLYVIEPESNICESYQVYSNDVSFMFNIRGYLAKQGFVQKKSQGKMKSFAKGSELCIIGEVTDMDSDNETINQYSYFMFRTKKK